MKTKTECRTQSWMRFKRTLVSQLSVLFLCLFAIEGAAQTNIVTDCTEAALRTAMAEGGTITFACDGTITLTNTITCSTDAILNGTGHQITITCSQAAPVFCVNSNVTFSVSNLTIANGRASSGAGILNGGGTVNLSAVTFRSNIAPLGGAVFNASGQMNLESCCFTNNRALASDPSQGAFGGAIYNAGSMNLVLCQFSGNSAEGAWGTFLMGIGPVASAEASGGAIYNSGQLTIDQTTLNANAAYGGFGYLGPGTTGSMDGGAGGSGADAFGGGICNIGSLSIGRTTLNANVVEGGCGGYGGNGLQFMDIGGNGGSAGPGGAGTGGALFNSGSANLVNCTIVFNSAQGGSGGTGGTGAGWVRGSSGYGGNGGGGGTGIDGGVSGDCGFINCTIGWNNSIAGAGGNGGAGSYGNPVPGLPGPGGSAWGANPQGFQLNVLLVSNAPAGNNTFSDPKLGPLADNGGPTLTMALLPGSPAIDAGDNAAAPPTDQRGFPRPVGAASDIGAYELCYIPVLQISSPQTSTINVLVYGLPSQSCRLLASDTLANWLPIATNQISQKGITLFQDNYSSSSTCRFYRVVTP